jgi:hypothetical protein
MPASAERFTLRALPLPPRLLIAAFLVTAAVGYLSALVQVHHHMAGPGSLLPGPAEVEDYYHGPRDRRSPLERLLEADSGPLNGAGTMRPAFTDQSRDWDRLTRALAPEQRARLAQEREGERLALLAWARGGADRGAYDDDDFPLGDPAGQPLTPDLLVTDPATGSPAQPPRVRLRTLIERRCVDCHAEGGRVELARRFPLDRYERLRPYCEAGPSRRLTTARLAQTTHVHLLGFAVLYGATGLAFCFTRYRAGVRGAVGLLPLAAQAVEVGCWWLARADPLWAWGVLALGPLAGLGLAAQVLGCLWDLFAPPTSSPLGP